MSASKKSILIIEDDESIREILKMALELEGYTPMTATHGQEALEYLREQKVEPCLILLDLMMPIMDGWSFVESVQKDEGLARIPIVIMTAFIEQAAQIKKARGLIRKPIDLDVLIKTVHQYCGNETQESIEVSST